MGNTKTYYVEGELLRGVTIEQFKQAVYEGFHSTYCVAEIVETAGGYLGAGCSDQGRTRDDEGPYLVAAIHSFSLRGDSGPQHIASLFDSFKMHRLDADWSDVKVLYYDKDTGWLMWRGDVHLQSANAGKSQPTNDSPEER